MVLSNPFATAWPEGMAVEYRPEPPKIGLGGVPVSVAVSGGDLVLASDREYVLTGPGGRIIAPAGTRRTRVRGNGHTWSTVELAPQWASSNPATSMPKCFDLLFEDLVLVGGTASQPTIRGDGLRIRFERCTASTPATNGLCLFAWGAIDLAVVGCHLDGKASHAQRLVNVTRAASWGGSRRSATHFAYRVHGTGGTSSYVWASDMELVGPMFCGYPQHDPPDSIHHLDVRRLAITAHGTGNCIQFAPPERLRHFTFRECTLKGALAVAQLDQLKAVTDPTWVQKANKAVPA